MKSLVFIALAASVMPLSAQEADHGDLVASGAATIHHIWTEWMEKPKLEYTRITKESAKDLHGTWKGSYVEDDEKIDLSVTLNADGTWISQVFRPDMKDGHWYLGDGMILLFEAKLLDDDGLASALILNGGKLRLLYGDVEAGYVELTKAEQGVAPQCATGPESDSEGGDKPQTESEGRSR